LLSASCSERGLRLADLIGRAGLKSRGSMTDKVDHVVTAAFCRIYRPGHHRGNAQRGGSREGDEVFAFLDTPHSFRLVKAFAKMADRRIQQCFVRLVEEVADKISAVR
jgi:hypothetical protein